MKRMLLLIVAGTLVASANAQTSSSSAGGRPPKDPLPKKKIVDPSGARSKSSKRIETLSELPLAVQRPLQTLKGGADLQIEKRTMGERSIYEVVFLERGKRSTLVLDEQGQIMNQRPH